MWASPRLSVALRTVPDELPVLAVAADRLHTQAWTDQAA